MDDRFRKKEFPALIQSGAVYADWTGAALPPLSLVEGHCRALSAMVLGNPHSFHRPSRFALELADEARQRVLSYFKADPSEYDVIFTANASAAILLLQHFMFEGGDLLLTADNHNSVNGLREVARRAGATVRYSPITDDLFISGAALSKNLRSPSMRGRHLFCYPAKSNWSGIRHELVWIEEAQSHGWQVMLDASAYVSNHDLDLSKYHPDFVPVSFYKMFGYPTGVGALIIRKSAYQHLHKKWFAGGAIILVSVLRDFFVPEVPSPALYEDGTVNFQSLPAVAEGLDFLERLASSGFDRSQHAVEIASSLRRTFRTMDPRASSDGNGVVIHSPLGTDVLSFSLVKGGKFVPTWEVEGRLHQANICVRTGCFCNPGCNEKVFGYTTEEFERFYHSTMKSSDMTLDRLAQYTHGKPIGAFRASFGYVNTMEDARRIGEFVAEELGKVSRVERGHREAGDSMEDSP